ncbi:MAG: hypothetical protein GXO69_01165 [Acidobacteria bacterium]|nr:hypothetical protein [Acidobacteriota bacterium]
MRIKPLFLLILCVIVALSFAPAHAGDSLLDALKNGRTTAQFQFSFEYSDFSDAANLNAAKGLTLRTRLGYRTGKWGNVQGFIQFHNLSQLLDDYRWPGGGNNNYDVIADPDGSRIHQGYLDISFGEHSALRAGRQEIIEDDARLIGNVGWRQNGQSFDGLTFSCSGLTDNTFTVSWITRVNTIFLTHINLDKLILLHDSYRISDNISISGFGYLLDTESEAPDSRDSATYGARLKGSPGIFSLDATYAVQTDFADGENHGGDMITVIGLVKAGNWKLGGGTNIISGQDGNHRPFDTLFSTAHKWNGWADQFLATNGGNLTNGLQDVFVQAGTAFGGIKFLAVAHWFDTTDANTYDGKYGTELDFLFTRKFNKNLSGLLKFAFYNADSTAGNPTTDETVIWARLNYHF